MINKIHRLHRLRQCASIANGCLDKPEFWLLAQPDEICERTGRQIVHHDDFLAIRHQRLRQMRPNKSRAAGNEEAFHLIFGIGRPSFFNTVFISSQTSFLAGGLRSK